MATLRPTVKSKLKTQNGGVHSLHPRSTKQTEFFYQNLMDGE